MTVLPWWFFAALFIVVGIVVTAFLLRKDAADPARRDRPALLHIGRFLAFLYAGLSLIGTVVNAIAMLANQAVQVALPVQQFWPEIYPWITLDPAPAASVVGGGFTTADVLVAGLGMDARVLLAAGNLVQGLTFVVIAVVIGILCHRLLGGSPFRPLLALSMTWAAVAIAVGGIVWQILLEIGGSIASRQVLELTGWRAEAPSEAMMDYIGAHFDGYSAGLPLPYPGFHLQFWPLFLGLALAAVAIAFRRSERLQRDTEGLV
jgi:hypothetical protein